MTERVVQTCRQCHSSAGFSASDDGFFYCDCCGAQADDIIDTGMDEEQFFNNYSASIRRARSVNVIAAEPISQVRSTPSQYFDHPSSPVDEIEFTADDTFGPGIPSDFGSPRKNLSYDDYYSEIRSRYLMGLQIMIQLICKALVDKFNVSPLVIGLVGPIWLRFLASTRIMADEWADQVVHNSEAHSQGEAEEFQPSAKYGAEPVNIHGKRLVMIWYRSLSSRIPISCSLAISFLTCHVTREAILPSDIVRWALEGKLPYLAAFSEVEKHLGSKSEACPISASRMFRPIQTISTQKLESWAAEIAKKIGLELPPVNFHAIASRYCRQLCLPAREILPMACQICEWPMPPELYLSANEFRIPTRACVMSVVIVAIRILFDVNGYGMWELSLSKPNSLPREEKCEEKTSGCKFDSAVHAEEILSAEKSEARGCELDGLDSRWNAVDLLQNLEAKYSELDDVFDYSRDLPAYIQYCKDVVFSGLQPSYEDLEEENLMRDFWDFYQNNKVTSTLDDQGVDTLGSSNLYNKRSRKATNTGEQKNWNSDDHNTCGTSRNSGISHHGDHFSNRSSMEFHKESAIRQMKLEMEENKFCYVPPRTRVKRKDYLHYARRRQDVYLYAVHADYYILLRSCAKVAQVETRVMHVAVLRFERRLNWLEKKIDDSLNLKHDLNDVCDFCA